VAPANTAALDLSRQIRAEKTRREFKKRRDEILYRARNLWTHLQYEECIDLLVSSQPQFPGDPEISKLLETARQPLLSHFNENRHPRLTPAIAQVSITGPYAAKAADDTPTRSP